MRLFNIILVALIATFGLSAQATTDGGKVMVVKTSDGHTARYNIADVEEITFEDFTAPAPRPVAVVSVENLTPSFIGVEGIAPGEELIAGETATLTITPGEILSGGFSDYHLMHIHVHVNDRVIVPAVTEGFVNGSESIAVDFIVPDDDCHITVCYSVQQQLIDGGYTMLLENHPSVRLYGVSPDEHYKYFDAYLKVEEAFVIRSVEFRMGDGEWHDVLSTPGCDWSAQDDVPNLYGIKIRPDGENVTGNVVLRVTGEQHQRYGITWLNATSKYMDVEKTVLPAQAIDGDVVTAEIWMNDDYYLYSASADCGVAPEVLYGAYVRFTMPASDVTVNLDVRAKIPVTYDAESEHVVTAEIYDAPDMYYGRPTAIGVPGEAVYIFVTAENGFKPLTATNSNGETFLFSHYGDNIYMAAVTIPEDALSMAVGVQCAAAHTVASAQEVVFNAGQLYAAGETVCFSIRVLTGKQIDSVTATTASGNNVEVMLDGPYGTFVMPDEDVNVTVVFSDLNDEETVSVIAKYDEELYHVSSSTNYDWDFIEGFSAVKNSTMYLSVASWEGDFFYVGVKIGDAVAIYPATIDPDGGQYVFGKAIVMTGNTVIKVGATEAAVSFDEPVADMVSVKAIFDEDQYSVRSSTNFGWNFAEGFAIEKGTSMYVTVYDNYGENFYVGVKMGDIVTVYPAVEDEDSGEFTFGRSITADADTLIKVGATEAAVQF